AMNVRKAYDLQPGRGDRYLDPYADRQRERWADFKARMLSLDFTTEESDRLVAAAREMFQAIADLSDDLCARFAI
ncbi:MAG: hypothetical protein VYC34_04185, partial [Planctomycetota bacterium]|nr:hypothetical protein [Planctomycetota bacterium]